MGRRFGYLGEGGLRMTVRLKVYKDKRFKATHKLFIAYFFLLYK